MDVREALGVLDTCLGVMTGYFASAGQVRIAASSIREMKSKNAALYVLVDPVLGDDGSLYVSNDVANAICDELLPLCPIMNRICSTRS